MMSDYTPAEHRQSLAGCTGCDWTSTDPRQSLKVAHTDHVASLSVAPKAPQREQEPPTLADLIAAHQPVIQGSGGMFTCSCRNWGWGDRRYEGTYAHHLAAAVEQHHADEKVRARDEALEEAARAIARTGGMASARVIRDLKSGER
jgi:hypothetical protein